MTCIITDMKIGKHGYGYTHARGYAHREAYTNFYGPIPQGAHILHRCDNKACVNPEHLYCGTDKDNARDRVARGQHRCNLQSAWANNGSHERRKQMSLVRLRSCYTEEIAQRLWRERWE
jgi:hypothetical protein